MLSWLFWWLNLQSKSYSLCRKDTLSQPSCHSKDINLFWILLVLSNDVTLFTMTVDHDMLRKAAVECMVNIVHHSAEVREKFCQADNERVKLWTLYCGEWEDNPDLALAAAGGLAILTEYSPQVCNKIMAVSSWMTILKVSIHACTSLQLMQFN